MSRPITVAAILLGLGLVVTPGFSGHASVSGAVALVADAAHVQAAAVWVGTTDGTALITKDNSTEVYGSTHPGPIWQQFMREATAAMQLDTKLSQFATPRLTESPSPSPSPEPTSSATPGPTGSPEPSGTPVPTLVPAPTGLPSPTVDPSISPAVEDPLVQDPTPR